MQIFFMTVPTCRRIFHFGRGTAAYPPPSRPCIFFCKYGIPVISSACQYFRPLIYPFSAGGWLCKQFCLYPKNK